MAVVVGVAVVGSSGGSITRGVAMDNNRWQYDDNIPVPAPISSVIGEDGSSARMVFKSISMASINRKESSEGSYIRLNASRGIWSSAKEGGI